MRVSVRLVGFACQRWFALSGFLVLLDDMLVHMDDGFQARYSVSALPFSRI